MVSVKIKLDMHKYTFVYTDTITLQHDGFQNVLLLLPLGR